MDESLTQPGKNSRAVCSMTMNELGTTKAVSALRFITSSVTDVTPNMQCSARNAILPRDPPPEPTSPAQVPQSCDLKWNSLAHRPLKAYSPITATKERLCHLRQKGLMVFTSCLLPSLPYTHFPSFTRFFYYIFISKYLCLKRSLDL